MWTLLAFHFIKRTVKAWEDRDFSQRIGTNLYKYIQLSREWEFQKILLRFFVYYYLEQNYFVYIALVFLELILSKYIKIYNKIL